MNDKMPSCVIDASFGIKLFITEALSDAAAAFAGFSQQGERELAVPDLFYVECANILWKHVRRYGYPLNKAQEDIRLVDEFMFVNYSTKDLTPAALRLALDKEISAYDACYVVLAKQLDCPLITADERLVHKFQGTEFNVVWLGDFDLSEPLA